MTTIAPMMYWDTFNFPSDDPDAIEGAVGRNIPAPLGGYVTDRPDMLLVPWVDSSSPRAFIALLRELERQPKPVVFVTVISSRLEELLKKRGYKYNPRVCYSKGFGEWVDGWRKEAP